MQTAQMPWKAIPPLPQQSAFSCLPEASGNEQGALILPCPAQDHRGFQNLSGLLSGLRLFCNVLAHPPGGLAPQLTRLGKDPAAAPKRVVALGAGWFHPN